jgi:transposase
MPAQYVKAYVKRNKNDAADAAAICEAVGRPSMRFVAIKTAEQQAALLLHRGRERLVRQRTQRHEGAKTLDRRHRVSITGAGDEFLLAATVQNLRKLARFSPYRPPAGCPSSFGEGLIKRDGRVRRVGRRWPSDPERRDHAVAQELDDRTGVILDDRN